MIKCLPGAPKIHYVTITTQIATGERYLKWERSLWCVYVKTQTTSRLLGRYKWPNTAMYHAKAP